MSRTRAVCKLADLAEGQLTPVMGGRVLVTLSGGAPLAVAARCPHQGADLCAGRVVARVDWQDGVTADASRPVLRCPWHGFEYDLASGLPLAAEPAHRRMRLRVFGARVEGDDVVLEV